MMKKQFKTIAFVLTMLSVPTLCLKATPVLLPLQVHYEDPTVILGNPHKGPLHIPSLSIDGSTILFAASCEGYELSLVNEVGETVYTTEIQTDCTSLELPPTLRGDYEIRLSNGGSFYFYVYITL